MSLQRPHSVQVALVEWLDERYPFSKSVAAELYRRVPNYAASMYHYLGGTIFLLVAIEFATGFLLGLYYVPDAVGNPAPAYTSVNLIQHEAYLGWLIRGVHFWGANLLIALVLLHMARVWWTGAYRAPRELNWMVGVIMLLLILAIAITGELLPWDAKSYLARGRELSILSGDAVLPSQVSGFVKQLLQGGPTVGPPTLLRFFMAHVFLLPAAISLLMYVHFRFVRNDGPAAPMLDTRQGDVRTAGTGPGAPSHSESPLADNGPHPGPALEPRSKRLRIGPGHVLYPMLAALALAGILTGGLGRDLAADMPEKDTHPYFPDQFWPYPIITAATLILLGLLAALLQANLQLSAPADPRVVGIPRPDWYFLFLFQFLKLGPELITSLVVPLLAVIGLLFWPLLDTAIGPRVARWLGWKSWPVPGRNVIMQSMFVAVIAALGFLTFWALAGPEFCLPWFINSPVCG
ncbi:MAG TPA: cytochrome b N-terminal domain-containing protein [Candidatus Dormibacteraeota bacterium]|nr:cytochrome b N-terminal domain-containing protein [Candidatus Dormibacteraeota bacterium]